LPVTAGFYYLLTYICDVRKNITAMNLPKAGEKAPDFQGINQDGKMISLSDYIGKKLILYFYPKNDTPGCTAEACNLNDNYAAWIEKGFEVVGISPDSSGSHRKFSDKYGLKFNLIADTGKKILRDYGVWGEKNMYGKKYFGVNRTTFIIDEQGFIIEVFTKVNTKNHTEQIIKTLNI
jgi:peroxiredoxin Q/BCP